MPAPSAEHAPLMREMSDELLKELPSASVLTWHVMEHDGFKALPTPQVYIAQLLAKDGTRIGGESLSSPENRIVARYQDRLGWTQREDGLSFAYSIKEAKEITDTEGMGMLDAGFADHPGLESF
jgi:hypothetical protein